jgi:nucleotide-binding universal stress UspA family protein
MFSEILVPTDGSVGMERVIDTASRLAETHDAKLHLVHAVHTASFANLPMETSWESVEGMLRDQGETALNAAKRRATADAIETTIVEGPPSRMICKHATETGCDLIVMGTHGRGGLNRILLGSVAERVVRSATVPVMTVRVDESGERRDTRDTEDGRAEHQPTAVDPAVSEVPK